MAEEKKNTKLAKTETLKSANTAASHTRSTPNPDEESKKHKTPLNAIFITFTVVVLAVFFGIQLISKTGVFHPAGQIIFADSASELNRDFVQENINLEEITLDSNLIIGTTTSTTALTDDNSILYDILLPVADFYSTASNISSEDSKEADLTSIWNLDNSQKLLSLDDNYYLDTFTAGGFFQYFTLEGNQADIDKVKPLLIQAIAVFPNSETVLTLAQTGVTALSRRMNTKLDQVGNASYFATYIGEFLNSFDYTHTSNESSFSASATGSNICSKPGMIDAITSSGINIIELTGNHNQDCGDQDAIDTIALYQSLGIQTFGGGTSATTAAIPLEIKDKGSNITLLGYNYSTGGYTLDETPGANFYTEEKARADIVAAKERGDFIIVDVQYFECNEYADVNENTTCDRADSAAGNQIAFFRNLIDMGADIVVGTSAHQPQTYEQYHGGEIYYGLGNLFFDQSAWPGTTRSIILVHYFWQGQLLQTRLIPTVYDNNFQTRLMTAADASTFLARLNQARPSIHE